MFVTTANYWSILRAWPFTVRVQWRLVQLATGCGIHDQSRDPKLVALLWVLTEANVGSAFFKFCSKRDAGGCDRGGFAYVPGLKKLQMSPGQIGETCVSSPRCLAGASAAMHRQNFRVIPCIRPASHLQSTFLTVYKSIWCMPKHAGVHTVALLHSAQEITLSTL